MDSCELVWLNIDSSDQNDDNDDNGINEEMC